MLTLVIAWELKSIAPVAWKAPILVAVNVSVTKVRSVSPPNSPAAPATTTWPLVRSETAKLSNVAAPVSNVPDVVITPAADTVISPAPAVASPTSKVAASTAVVAVIVVPEIVVAAMVDAVLAPITVPSIAPLSMSTLVMFRLAKSIAPTAWKAPIVVAVNVPVV